jgi:hypothetical protein
VSELTLVLIRIAFLAILWIFVLSTVGVLRSDLFGARAETKSNGTRKGQPKPVKAPKRSVPTHVAVVDGPSRGERVELSNAPILIGRGSDAAIRLDDDYVSTRHARIATNGDQWFVEDLGSTNGTYIGSVRLTRPTAITIGTRVRIGKTTVELRK